MSHLYSRGKKIYFAYRLRPGAKAIRIATGLETDSRGRITPEAKEWKRQKDQQISLNRHGLASVDRIRPVPLSQLFLLYRSVKADSKKESSWGVALTAERALLGFFGDIQSDALTEQLMIEFRNHYRSAKRDGAAHTYLMALNPVFLLAVKRRHMAANPITEDVRFEYKPKVRAGFTPQQLTAWWNWSRAHNLNAYYQTRFLYFTAFRSDDSCVFRTSMIDFDAEEIHYANSKGNRTEVFPMFAELKELLHEVLRERPRSDGFVFAYRKRWNLYDAFKDSLSPAGLPTHLTIHSFKAAAADFFIDRGLSAFEVSLLLHHTNIQTTFQSYIKKNAARLRLQLNGEVRTPEMAEALIARQAARIKELEAELADLRSPNRYTNRAQHIEEPSFRIK